jgi:peptidoglycan/LPS O-acetylase OafA/YrhL
MLHARAVIPLALCALIVVYIVTGPTLLEPHPPGALLVLLAVGLFLWGIDELGDQGQRRRQLRAARRRARRRGGFVR